MQVIRRFARSVAERFQPEKVILFGSHAYGTPHADSDVDILVIMAARNELAEAMRIRQSVDYSFPLDLLVRTPRNLAWRLAEGDGFLQEIMAKGRILMKRMTREWVQKAEAESLASRSKLFQECTRRKNRKTFDRNLLKQVVVA